MRQKPPKPQPPWLKKTSGGVSVKPTAPPASRVTEKFCCSYRHDGADWAVMIEAYDWDDAEARVKKLGYLRLDGKLIATVPVGWIGRLISWLRRP
jgi:hypothetical protein